jgi:hypothetical protein
MKRFVPHLYPSFQQNSPHCGQTLDVSMKGIILLYGEK